MNRSTCTVLAGIAIAAGVSSVAHAGWYAGDPAATTAVPLAAFAWTTNIPSPGYVDYPFDNFTWTNAGGGIVDTLGGFYISTTGVALSNVTYAQWEIRSGVSVGNAGTLVASGSGVPVTTATAFTTQFVGYSTLEPVVRVELDVSDFALAPGNYWFGMGVGDAGNNVGAFVAETIGANGIGGPLDDGNAIYFQGDGTNNPFNYVDVAATWGSPMDMSYFVTEVPTPSALALLTLGTGVLLRRRR
jgi:uncharacterized protein (TIGR03382 family)